MEQMSMQKRLLLAALLSIVFFIVYDFFMPKRVMPEQNQTTMSQTIDQNKAPNTNQNTPKSNENLASNEIIATIRLAHNTPFGNFKQTAFSLLFLQHSCEF